MPFAGVDFDDVAASLVLHHLEDWSGALAELRRVLKPGGRLMVSVNHPCAYPIVHPLRAWSRAGRSSAFCSSCSRPSEAHLGHGRAVSLDR